MDPALQELIVSTPENRDIEVILKLSDEHHLPHGVQIITQFGNIATCRLKKEAVEEVWSSESVTSVKAPRYLDSEPVSELTIDGFSGEEIAEVLKKYDRFDRTHQVTGKGIIVAILDWGCDFAHPNFCNEDGSTRLLALWDQSAASTNPNKYGYGQIYTRDDINRALASEEPYATLGYHSAKSDSLGNGTHGTAVMDIAAGNGLAGNSPVGIAPEADLIFVHLDAGKGTSGLLANLGDSVRLLEALDFVVETAEEQPWVANLSLGRTGGEHTGQSLVEQGMDELLSAAPSRAIVQSTGNYYKTRTHAGDRLLPHRQHSLNWLVSPTDVTPNELEIWYPGSDRFLVKLRPPDSNLEFSVALGHRMAIEIDGREVGRMYHRDRDPNNNDNHIDIFLDRAAPSGRWNVTLIGEDVVDGRFHAWIERDFGRSTNQSRFELADAVPSYTTNTICNGKRTIAVGAYDPNSLDFQVAPFSSSGPTRDGRLKPDILAPGVGIVAARSTARGSIPGSENSTIKSGTSFAAPQVAGAIALLFAAVAPRKLNITETRNIVLSNADKAQNQEPWRVGNGYLNIRQMLGLVKDRYKAPINLITRPTITSNERELSMNSQNIDLETPDLDLTLETRDEELTESSTTNFILLSGGPGLFDNRDVEHDRSWANYVTPPLLLTSSFDPKTKKTKVDPEKLKQFENGQEVWWLIYRPAYIRRWEDDLKRKSKAAKNVKAQGFNSYIELLEARAKARNWNLSWFDSASELWGKLKTFNDPIARFWYWGHARDGLWLSLAHSSRAVAVAPASSEIITVDSIKANASLKKRFQKGSSSRVHRFIGCNTTQFAQTWAKTFSVYTEGFEGQIDFRSIHKTDGEPTPVSGAELKKFSSTGSETTTESIDESIETTDLEVWEPNLVVEEGFDDLEETQDEDTEDTDVERENTLIEQSPPWNAYVYIVGADTSGKTDYNGMRKLLQQETSRIYPWVIITYDFHKGQFDAKPGIIRKSWKKDKSSADRNESSPLKIDFSLIYHHIEKMKEQNIQIKELHFLTHFLDDAVRYRWGKKSSTSDLAKRNQSKFAAAFADNALVKIHGCQQDPNVLKIIKEFCQNATFKRRVQILQEIRDRVEQSYPHQLAKLIGQNVWAGPIGTYSSYNCEYLEAKEQNKRFCVEVPRFQRTVRFYEASYDQIFDRLLAFQFYGTSYHYEPIFDSTYHLKYKPQLKTITSFLPSDCPAKVPPRIGAEDVVNDFEAPEVDSERLEPAIYPVEVNLLSEGLNLSRAINPVELYDSLQFDKYPALSSGLSEQFEVIAYPGERLEQSIQEGDVVVRRALGEPLGYVAVIAEANLWSKEEIATTGSIPESHRPGSYAHIIDEGSSFHEYADVARLIVDQHQRVPNYQILLRPRHSWETTASIAEQTVTAPAPRIRFRPCCILAPRIPLGRIIIIDPSNIGNHKGSGSNEKNGLIYSGKAGFLDIGHIRELCDLTKHIYDQIAANNGTPLIIRTSHGKAVFRASIDRSLWAGVAMAIAYDDSVGYEIYTYTYFSIGGHHSSFSPEDLCSNFLGTLVAESAISTGGGFNKAVTKELNQLIRDLDGQNQAESLKAFNLIKKSWVDFNSAASVMANDYLKRRNFSQTPWKTGHSSDSSTPAWVTASLPNYSHYEYTHTTGRSIPKSRFATEIARIRIDARKRYGANYDRP